MSHRHQINRVILLIFIITAIPYSSHSNADWERVDHSTDPSGNIEIVAYADDESITHLSYTSKMWGIYDLLNGTTQAIKGTNKGDRFILQ
jgi:hypothetical protein